MTIREGVIRKISVGENIKDAMCFEVGKRVNNNKYLIHEIKFSDVDSYMYDCIVLNIIVKEGDFTFKWKSLVDFKNVIIEYAGS